MGSRRRAIMRPGDLQDMFACFLRGHAELLFGGPPLDLRHRGGRREAALHHAAVEGYRLAAAIQTGEGTEGALDSFLRESLSLEHVDQIERRFASDFNETAPSDKAALAKTLITMAGPQIKASLEGLGPVDARNVLQTAFSKIVAKFYSGGEISVSVKCAARSVSPEKAELITMPIGHNAA